MHVKLVYVYQPQFESGGMFWPKLFAWSIVGMVLYQVRDCSVDYA